MLLNFVYSTYMNEDNRKYIWACIQKAGDYLDGQLPSHTNHTKGRNPYYHVTKKKKNKFNISYKDIDDNLLKEVLDYIEYLKDNPK